MKKIFIGFIIGFMLGTFISSTIAVVCTESIWNRVFDSTNNVIVFKGLGGN